MKPHLLILVLMTLLLAGSLEAKQTSIFDMQTDEIGAMGGWNYGVASLGGDAAMVYGGRLQVLINHSTGLGLCGYGVYGIPDQTFNSKQYEMRMGFTGMDVEWILDAEGVVHTSLYGMFGGGRINAREEGTNKYYADDFYTLMPMANVEINMMKHMRLGIGAGYLYNWDVNVVGMSNQDLNGPIANVTFKFGWF